MESLIEAMTDVVEDLYGHVYRVSTFATHIGRAIGLDQENLDRLSTVGVLHDVGKIHVDPEILAKPGPLVADEIRRMRRHPEFGFAMTIDAYDRSIAEAILHHHERWDGNGYPFGLRKNEIPILARIVLVADAFDAITSHRSYQPALPVDYALDELRAHAGTQFDPDLALAFADLVETGTVEVNSGAITALAV
ncbi:MAG: HD domain-containing protein [Acidimicrobiia bacterium]|nr:HD domain-containing protein [Acidimicrobiia bacterium]